MFQNIPLTSSIVLVIDANEACNARMKGAYAYGENPIATQRFDYKLPRTCLAVDPTDAKAALKRFADAVAYGLHFAILPFGDKEVDAYVKKQKARNAEPEACWYKLPKAVREAALNELTPSGLVSEYHMGRPKAPTAGVHALAATLVAQLLASKKAAADEAAAAAPAEVVAPPTIEVAPVEEAAPLTIEAAPDAPVEQVIASPADVTPARETKAERRARIAAQKAAAVAAE